MLFFLILSITGIALMALLPSDSKQVMASYCKMECVEYLAKSQHNSNGYMH